MLRGDRVGGGRRACGPASGSVDEALANLRPYVALTDSAMDTRDGSGTLGA